MPRYPQAMLVSCEIPWDENESLMEDVFRAEVRHLLQDFHHLYIFGTAGEGYAVNSRDFARIVAVFAEETLTRPDAEEAPIYPMVGVIGLSTAVIVERLEVAYAAGFRTFQISLPSWGVLSDGEVMRFFRDVCGRFPQARFLHYNLPRAGRLLDGSLYKRLVAEVPNLVATKNTGGGGARAADLMRNAPELQHFFGEANFAQGALYGECSLLATMGPLTPHQSRTYFQAGLDGDLPTLLQMQKGFHDLLIDVLGPYLQQPFIDGAYDKMMKRLGGFTAMPLRMLSPYQGMDEEAYNRCRAVLHERYPDWVAPAARA